MLDLGFREDLEEIPRSDFASAAIPASLATLLKPIQTSRYQKNVFLHRQ
jgi:hypothetical protein